MIWKIPFIGSHNGAVPPVGGSPVENVLLLEDLGVEGALCKFDPHDDVGEDNCEIMMMSCLTSRSSIVVPGASWKLEEWNGLWRSPSRQILLQPWRVNNLENGPNLSQPYLVKKIKERRQDKRCLCVVLIIIFEWIRYGIKSKRHITYGFYSDFKSGLGLSQTLKNKQAFAGKSYRAWKLAKLKDNSSYSEWKIILKTGEEKRKSFLTSTLGPKNPYWSWWIILILCKPFSCIAINCSLLNQCMMMLTVIIDL